MMKALARRGFLKALGVAPMAAQGVANHLAKNLVSRVGVSDGSVTGMRLMQPTPATKPDVFRTVADWWATHGEKQARSAARAINGFDGDLVEMRLPIATKARIQRERNYERAKEEMTANMSRHLSLAGIIEWWK